MHATSLIQSKPQLTYAAAAIAIEAAVEKSREIAAPECIAVVDAGGTLLAFARVEGAAVLARDQQSQRPPLALLVGHRAAEYHSNSAPISVSRAMAASSTWAVAFRLFFVAT